MNPTPSTSDDDLTDKVAVVTGAASGIGRATVELLVERGVRVVVEDRDEAVEELAGPTIAPLTADVTDEDSARRAVALARERFGRLDILVNNAGIIINKTVADMTLDDWNSVLAVNATGAFLHSREAVRAMTPQGSGAVVNVGSYACFQAFPTIAAYAASKGALAQLTRTLALEVVGHGIRVNAVGTGDTVTHILDDIHEDGPGFLADHGSTTPIGRAAQPGDRRGHRVPRLGPGELPRRLGRHGRRRDERRRRVITSPPRAPVVPRQARVHPTFPEPP